VPFSVNYVYLYVIIIQQLSGPRNGEISTRCLASIRANERAKMKTVSRLHQVASTKWFRPRNERGRLANFDYRHALDCLHGSWTCTGL